MAKQQPEPQFTRGAPGPNQAPYGETAQQNRDVAATPPPPSVNPGESSQVTPVQAGGSEVAPQVAETAGRAPAPAPPEPSQAPATAPNYPKPVHATERAQFIHEPNTEPADFRLVQPEPLPTSLVWAIPYLQQAASDPNATDGVKQLYWEVMQRVRLNG